MNKQILIADDNEEIVDLLIPHLVKEGFMPIVARDGEEALKLFKENKPILVLLDIMMPKKNGITVCKEIRNESKTPIVMVTAKSEDEDVIMGLDVGADDYIVKPFSPKQVVAKVKAIIRRLDISDDKEKLVTIENLQINMNEYTVKIDNKNIELTKKVIEIAHPLNISVEAELGTIGTTDGDSEGGTEEIIYTKPEDAVKFVEETGCDCLAIAIGTAHGIYPEGFEPHLKLDLLSEIKSSVSIPLVLHGGSANPDTEIAEAVKRGVNKINISSDIKDAFFKECRVVLENKKLREPLDIFPACIEKMNETVVHKIRLFNSNDKLKYYSL